HRLTGIFFATAQTSARVPRRTEGIFWEKAGKAHGTHTLTTVVGRWKQRMADGRGDLSRAAKHSGSDRPLWRHRQEEVGTQFRLHVDVCLRIGFGRLGPV